VGKFERETGIFKDRASRFARVRVTLVDGEQVSDLWSTFGGHRATLLEMEQI